MRATAPIPYMELSRPADAAVAVEPGQLGSFWSVRMGRSATVSQPRTENLGEVRERPNRAHC